MSYPFPLAPSLLKLRARLPLPLAAASLLAGVIAPSGAGANASWPPHHRIFHGVSDTDSLRDFRVFNRRVRAHSALLQDFYHWGTPLNGALDRWRATRTRGVLSLSTAPGGKPELISPKQIANGRGDEYLLKLNRSIAASGQVVYIRLMPEMNGSWNPYCAYAADGSYRGSGHSTANFRRAWRRFALIVKGGSRLRINTGLRRNGMPRILRASSNDDPLYEQRGMPAMLPRPRVAFMWNPQTIGSPNLAGNQPRDYWPGGRYVDWVGADIYSRFASPGIWSLFRHFYRQWRRWPFVVGEYSPWDNDYRGGFTRKLFRWAEKHRRVRALIYYRSVTAGNAFDINHWSAAKRVIRHHLNKHRFDPYPPGAGS
jgi:hypothetical protein